ncbi:unnamed protein product [Symbiodinium necroappetens]|uniref:Uncharacterized protein n=1 Tax=Symbiodinium necroappetens TaxID=1628268 RepID=A0A812JJC1_9DINO|nr:unnamed protein product [Symbiodinium necroappetens]
MILLRMQTAAMMASLTLRNRKKFWMPGKAPDLQALDKMAQIPSQLSEWSNGVMATSQQPSVNTEATTASSLSDNSHLRRLAAGADDALLQLLGLLDAVQDTSDMPGAPDFTAGTVYDNSNLAGVGNQCLDLRVGWFPQDITVVMTAKAYILKPHVPLAQFGVTEYRGRQFTAQQLDAIRAQRLSLAIFACCRGTVAAFTGQQKVACSALWLRHLGWRLALWQSIESWIRRVPARPCTRLPFVPTTGMYHLFAVFGSYAKIAKLCGHWLDTQTPSTMCAKPQAGEPTIHDLPALTSTQQRGPFLGARQTADSTGRDEEADQMELELEQAPTLGRRKGQRNSRATQSDTSLGPSPNRAATARAAGNPSADRLDLTPTQVA